MESEFEIRKNSYLMSDAITHTEQLISLGPSENKIKAYIALARNDMVLEKIAEIPRIQRLKLYGILALIIEQNIKQVNVEWNPY